MKAGHVISAPSNLPLREYENMAGGDSTVLLNFQNKIKCCSIQNLQNELDLCLFYTERDFFSFFTFYNECECKQTFFFHLLYRKV